MRYPSRLNEPNRHPAAYAIPTHIQFQVHQQTQIGQCLGTNTLLGHLVEVVQEVSGELVHG